MSSGSGLRYGMLPRIFTAWILTPPVTILVAGALYYLLADAALRELPLAG